MINGYEITIDDLPDGFREVVDAIGMDNALLLAEKLGGAPIYIPTPKEIRRGPRNRAIRAEFNGQNHRELARKYDLSTSWIRVIVGPSGRRSCGVDTVDNQLPLF